MQLSHHTPISRQLASILLVIVSQSLATPPDWARRFQLTRLYVLMSIYRSAARLVGTGSVVPVVQATDRSTRFVTTPATSPRRYGDQLFFVAMAQEWRNGPRRLREHDDDDDGWQHWSQECIRINPDIRVIWIQNSLMFLYCHLWMSVIDKS